MGTIKYRGALGETTDESADLRFDLDAGRLGRLLALAAAERVAPSSADGRTNRVPALTRPNDPLMAADVRAIAGQTIEECIVAGSAEIVTEVALPIESRALALALNVPVEHAEEWISWGPDEPAGDERRRRSSAVDAYIERQFDRARGRPGSDFFSLLVGSGHHDRRHSRDELRQFAALTLAADRDLTIRRITEALARLAESRSALDEFRHDPGRILSAADAIVADGPRDRRWRSHTALVLRSVFSVLARRVERLTLLAADGDERDGFRRLLLNFRPLD